MAESELKLVGKYAVMMPATAKGNNAVQINGRLGLFTTPESAVAAAKPVLGEEKHMLENHVVVCILGSVAEFESGKQPLEVFYREGYEPKEEEEQVGLSDEEKAALAAMSKSQIMAMLNDEHVVYDQKADKDRLLKLLIKTLIAKKKSN